MTAVYLVIGAIAAAIALAMRQFVLASFSSVTSSQTHNEESAQEKVNEMLYKTGQLLQPAEIAETRTRILLAQSGISLDPITWRGIQVVSIIASLGLAIWLITFLRLEATLTLLAMLICISGGVLAPIAYLKGKKKSRQDAIACALPSSLELLNTAVRAGFPIERGIRMVAINTSGPLSEELKRVDREITLIGVPLEVALERLKKRCDTQSVTTFCNSLIHATKQGTSITRTLNAQASSVRDDYYTNVLVKINQLPNKMIPVIFIVFFPIIIALSVVPIAYNAAMTVSALM